MTFLNPAILWALLAVSVPILIHIFNLRKTRKIEFSTLMFLREIQQTQYKKIKLKQLLILLCRIGFITLLVISFSKPYAEGYLGKETSSSLLIIIDNSFSMEALEKNGTRLSSGIQKIRELIQSLNDDDEIYFTTTSSLNNTKNLKPYRKYEIEDLLNDIRFSQISRNIDEIIHYSSVILNNALNDRKEVFLVTDLQQHFYRPSGIIKRNFFNQGLHFNIINVAERKSANISADTIEVLSGIFEKSRPVKIKLTVSNRNNFDVNSLSIILRSDSFTSEKIIDISSNTSVDVIFEMPAEKSGYISGYAEILREEISRDEISLDNKQYFCIYMPDKIRLLALGNTEDFQYIRYATDASAQLVRQDNINDKEYINIKYHGNSLDGDLNLSYYDALLIVNKKSFSEVETQKLRDFLASGKGVIIYPGSNVSSEAYNIFFNELGLGNGFSVTETGSAVKFTNLDLRHPLLDGIFLSETNTIGESPEIHRLFFLPSENNHIPSVSPITLSNGQAFIKEYIFSKGKLILFSVSPDVNGSNYALSNIFAPLTLRSILYSASVNQPATAVTGKDYLINSDNFNITDSVILISDDARNVYPVKKSSFIKINDIKSASVYSLYSSDNLIYQFPATFDRKESDDSRFSTEDIKTLFRDNLMTDVNVYSPNENLISSVRESRSGKGLWQFFLLGAIIFLILEYIISRTVLKKAPKKTP